MSNMISGTDVIFETTRQGFEVGPLLEGVLEIWPDGLFQDAEGEDIHPLAAALADPRTSDLHEFFVYKDRSSAESWDKEGWTEQYGNDMAHFLFVEDSARPEFLQVTLVIGSATSDTIRLIASVFDALTRIASGVSALRGRSRRIDWEAELQAVGYTSGRERFYEKVEVPDHLVMKALLNRRKQRKKGSASFEPRLLWRA
jgi:hypothetical protein